MLYHHAGSFIFHASICFFSEYFDLRNKFQESQKLQTSGAQKFKSGDESEQKEEIQQNTAEISAFS